MRPGRLVLTLLACLVAWAAAAQPTDYRAQVRAHIAAGNDARALQAAEEWLVAAQHPRRGHDTTQIAARTELAAIYRLLGRYPQAQSALQPALALARLPAYAGTRQAARAHTLRGQLFLDLDLQRWAVLELDTAVSILDALGPREDDALLEPLELQASIAYLNTDYITALDHYTRISAIQERRLGYQSAPLARTLNNLAGVYLRTGNTARALGLYQHALNMQRAVLGEDHPELATTLTNLGVYYDEIGEFEAAERELQAALALRERVLPAGDPLIDRSLDNLVSLYLSLDRYLAVETALQAAQERRSKASGAISLPVAAIQDRWATYWIARKEPANAEARFTQALQIREQLLPEQDPLVAGTLYNIAKLQILTRHEPQAIITLHRALECYIRDVGRHEEAASAILAELFTACVAIGDPAAESHLLTLLSLKEEIYGKQSLAAAEVLDILAEYYRRADRVEEATLQETRAKTIRDQR
jgi:tetratricopeptide (TPR) repeat protein